MGVLAYELMMGGATPFFHESHEQTEQLIQQVGAGGDAGQPVGRGGWKAAFLVCMGMRLLARAVWECVQGLACAVLAWCGAVHGCCCGRAAQVPQRQGKCSLVPAALPAHHPSSQPLLPATPCSLHCPQCDVLPTRFPRHQMFSPWADFVRTILVHDPARRPSAAQLLSHNWIQHHERQAERLRRLHSLQLLPRHSPGGLARIASMPALGPARAQRPTAQASRLGAAGAAAAALPAAAAQPAKPLALGGSACSVLDGLSGRSSLATVTDYASSLDSARSSAGTAAAAPVQPAPSGRQDVEMLPAGLPPSPFWQVLPPAPPRGIEAALAAEAARLAAMYGTGSSGSLPGGGALQPASQPPAAMPPPPAKPAGAVGRVAAAIRRQTKSVMNKVRWPRGSREASRRGTAHSRSNSVRSAASDRSDRSRGNSIVSVGSGAGDRSRSSSILNGLGDRSRSGSLFAALGSPPNPDRSLQGSGDRQ